MKISLQVVEATFPPIAVLGFVALLPMVCEASRPYCGVYALYGGAKTLGVDANLEELIDPQYITSFAGSSIEDLQRAADHIGVEATPLFGLGRPSLDAATTPLILHVTPRGLEGSYTHWVLFMGMEGEQAIIHDGVGGITRCSIDSLLARWDGIALAIHLPGEATNFLGSEISRLLFMVMIAIGVLWVMDQDGPRLSLRKQTVVLISLSLLAAIPYYYVRFSGESPRTARRGIDAALGRISFAEISCHGLRDQLDSSPPILIDCRYERDYRHGSIDGAINLPIDAGDGEFNRVLKDIATDAEMVVFCQSAQCRFSHYAAAMLVGKGFDNIRILTEGYAGWVDENGNE